MGYFWVPLLLKVRKWRGFYLVGEELIGWRWMYLVQNVGQTGRKVDREYDKDNVAFWIA
jgi:hypothetical protein